MSLSKPKSKFHQHFPRVQVHSQIQLSFHYLWNYFWSKLAVSVYQHQSSLIPKDNIGKNEMNWRLNRCFFHITLFESREISFDNGLLEATCSYWNITGWIQHKNTFFWSVNSTSWIHISHECAATTLYVLFIMQPVDYNSLWVQFPRIYICHLEFSILQVHRHPGQLPFPNLSAKKYL